MHRFAYILDRELNSQDITATHLKERHLLLIAYYYPPMASVGAIRMKNIADAARNSFDKVHVITTRNAYHFGPMEDADLHPIPTLDYRAISLNHLKRKDLHYGGKSTQSKWKKWAGQLLSTIPAQFTVGEGGGMYIYYALEKAEELIANHPISHIVSSFPPMADHHIARKLKQRHPALHWVADFRDLPVDKYKENIMASQWHSNQYKQLFSEANAAWAVSEGQAELLQSLLNKEIEVVRNGLPEDYSLNTTGYQTGPFRMSYTGSLYPHYPYKEFIESLMLFHEKWADQAEKMEFHYAGKDSSLMQSLLKSANWAGEWVDHGNISLKASRELQQKSHINWLFTWSQEESKGVLTGKVYEYLGARRPLLALVNGEKEEELQSLLKTYHGEASEPCVDAECAYDFLCAVFEKYKEDGYLTLLGEVEKLEDLYFSAPL